MLIRRVMVDDVWPPAHQDTTADVVDLRIVGDRIDEIGPRLAARVDEAVIEGHGGSVIPGLHDHHVHLRAWAAAASSVEAGPPAVTSAEQLAQRLRSAPGARGTWIRAVGYHESTAGDLDRHALDALMAERPVRLQHRTGGLWILNSRALDELGLFAQSSDMGASGRPAGVELDAAGSPTGRIWREDRWLHDQLATLGATWTPDLSTVSRQAARLGVTGFTDATPNHDASAIDALVSACDDGSIPQRLHFMISADAPAPDVPGARLSSRCSVGPVKVLLDDATLPSFDDLVALLRRAHAGGRPVAVHCVTRTQAAFTVAAFAEAGSRSGDRMEHGAVLGSDILEVIRALGLTVVTQPGFVFSRGDRYLVDVEHDDRDDLWRLGSLIDAGLPVALGTDAPFGPDDPWVVARVAATRQTAGGRSLGATERISARRALGLFCGSPERPSVARSVAPDAVADLVILAEPLDATLAGGDPTVLATIVAGTVVHRAETG
jgi:predicted amidohydrolase YtcJ